MARAEPNRALHPLRELARVVHLLLVVDEPVEFARLVRGEIAVERRAVELVKQRFVAEDSYHGRTGQYLSEQPDQRAYLIVDEEIFAYPEIETAMHRLVDGYETIEEMEAGLDMPPGALSATLERYNADAAAGEDRLFYKHPNWLKPLDQGPYAAFDISFNRSRYLFITLGGLKTDIAGRVLATSGQPIAGLFAAGACAAHLPKSGKSYASGMSLGPGSYFARVAGRAIMGRELE